MNMIDKAIAVFSPRMARIRVQERFALDQITMRYEAATSGNRGKSWRPVGTDADAAGAQRGRLAFVARDMMRNNAYAGRVRQVIANNVVGDGIIPKVTGGTPRQRKRLLAIIQAHLDTTAIDADGRLNLYGLQRLALESVVTDGEVLIRRRRRDLRDRLPLPFQIQVIEIDYLATTEDGALQNGNVIREGIEYDQIGRRVAYHLYSEHPGSQGTRLRSASVRRVDASEIIHLYRVDRPGQMRGVSWLAPVALRLQDLADYNDAQLMRQKIAACFAAFVRDTESTESGDSLGLSQTLVPGRIQRLGPNEELEFSSPPGVEAYDEFTRGQLREVAAGVGITYEALTGDLSQVNFSSGRMGRMEMDRLIQAWQFLMMVPGLCDPLAAWIMEAHQVAHGRTEARLAWVPPQRILIDPAREIKAMADEISAGLASRSQKIRQLGYDPEEVLAECAADQAAAAAHGLHFTTDVGQTRAAPSPETVPADDDDDSDKEDAA